MSIVFVHHYSISSRQYFVHLNISFHCFKINVVRKTSVKISCNMQTVLFITNHANIGGVLANESMEPLGINTC